MKTLFTMQIPWFEILVRTLCVYLLVLAGLRLTGKRQISQLAPFDLVLLLLISNAVQNAMTGPDTSLQGGIIAAITLLMVNSGFAYLVRKSHFFSYWVEGTATLLINQGHVLESHMKREGISYDELLQALREHGVNDPVEVRLAILEVDGAISVIKNEDVKKEYRSKKQFRYLKRHHS